MPYKDPKLRRQEIQKVYARKRAILAELRSTGCVDCERVDGLFHFEHRPGTDKLFNPGRGFLRTEAVLRAEVAKCDVRCHACHMKRHRLERWISQTSCPHGHPYDAANTYWRNGKYRECRECARLREEHKRNPAELLA